MTSFSVSLLTFRIRKCVTSILFADEEYNSMLAFSRMTGKFISHKINFNSIKMSSTTQSLSTIITKLNSFAPISLAQNWDNVGLLIEPYTPK